MGVGVYQEKDVSLGGRHESPFLLLVASTPCRHPPSMYSRMMIGSAKLHSLMLAIPTKPTTLGCIPILDSRSISHTKSSSVRFLFRVRTVRSSRITCSSRQDTLQLSIPTDSMRRTFCLSQHFGQS